MAQLSNSEDTGIAQTITDCASELAILRSISDVQSNLQLQGKITFKLFGLMTDMRNLSEPEPLDSDADGFTRMMEVDELGILCIRTQKQLRIFFKKIDAFNSTG